MNWLKRLFLREHTIIWRHNDSGKEWHLTVLGGEVIKATWRPMWSEWSSPQLVEGSDFLYYATRKEEE